MVREYSIVLVQEGRKWWAYLPDVPGVYGAGRTEKAAKKDAAEALALYVEDALADGDSVPLPLAKRVEVDSVRVAVGK